MGVWGTGIYDNDHAADYGHEILEGGLGAIQRAFQLAQRVPYVETETGNAALVAADVVARLRSGGGETSSYAESVALWVAAANVTDTDALAVDARASIARVLTRDVSEMLELWAETDDLAEWLGVINELVDRLA